MEEFKPVLFEKKEFQYRELSLLLPLLQLSAEQDSHSNLGIKHAPFKTQVVLPRKTALS